jgi:hypothetical protein
LRHWARGRSAPKRSGAGARGASPASRARRGSGRITSGPLAPKRAVGPDVIRPSASLAASAKCSEAGKGKGRFGAPAPSVAIAEGSGEAQTSGPVHPLKSQATVTRPGRIRTGHFGADRVPARERKDSYGDCGELPIGSEKEPMGTEKLPMGTAPKTSKAGSSGPSIPTRQGRFAGSKRPIFRAFGGAKTLVQTVQ